MKETAVEWLLENLNSEPYSEEEFNYNKECWDKAKEMEKEQISQAYVFGSAYGIDVKNGLNPKNYYNETFKQ
jgi:hypothetical protein